MSLALRLPSWLGDFVQAEPLVRELAAQARDGGTRVTLIGPQRFLELVAPSAATGFDGVRRIALDAAQHERAASYRGHDLALFLNGSWRSVALALAAGVPERVGWARGGRGPLLTRAVVPARERGHTPVGLGRAGRVPRALPRPFGAACVELAGEAGLCVRDRRPALAPLAAARETVERRLCAAGLAGQSFVLVDVGARSGSAKGYPPEAWREVLASLARELGLALVATAGPGEQAALDAALPAGSLALAWPAPSLQELVALAARARLYVGTDSGPRHLAVAAGADAVVVCGPTDPRHTAEHLERTRFVRHTVPCGPCHRERCPLAGAVRHTCMHAVLPDEIVAAARASLR